METFDWMVQGISGLLSAWLLRGWWTEDRRIPAMAKVVAIVAGVLGVGTLLVSVAYSQGISQQWTADLDAQQARWKSLNEKVNKLDASLRETPLSLEQRLMINKLTDIPDSLPRVDTAIMSSRSVWMFLALWIVANLVSAVPVPSSSPASPEPETPQGKEGD